MNRKEYVKTVVGIIVIVLFFLVSSYLVQSNAVLISGLLNGGVLGAFMYVFIVITAVVVAPVSATPLIPIATALWGVIGAALLSIAGWAIGALIAFSLARKFGIPLVGKFVPVKKLFQVESLIPQRNLFWSIVFLRMAIPVDVLSYALGLFCNISARRFFFATLIGVTPFAFVLAYAGSVSVVYQILALIIGLVVLGLGVLVALAHKKTIRNRMSKSKSIGGRK